MLKNAELMADMLSALLYDAADRHEAETNGSRLNGPVVQLLKQAAFSVKSEYGTPDHRAAPAPDQP